MIYIVLLWCVLVNGDNTPSLLTTNATIAIIIDREYLKEEHEIIKTSIENFLIYAKREILKHGGLNAIFYSWTAINLKREFTAILSIVSCADTWKLFTAAKEENLFHMAISEADCPRLPSDQAITIPILERGQELPQLSLDLRTRRIYNWKSVVIIYDYTIITGTELQGGWVSQGTSNIYPPNHVFTLTTREFKYNPETFLIFSQHTRYEMIRNSTPVLLGNDLLTRVIKSLTKPIKYLNVQPASISLVKLDPTDYDIGDVRSSLRDRLSTINPKTVGGNFVVIVSYDLVEIIMEYAKSLNLVNTKYQWSYIISDTNYKFTNINRLKRMLKEGDNVAFIYNSTVINDTCKGGIICYSEEVLTGFTKALDSAVIDEFETASQVSEEEWEAIRPTALERRLFLLKQVQKYLKDYGTCDNCTWWQIKTGETWGREYISHNNTDSIAEILSVGTWRPSDGPTMTDELFPHIVHGFRQKTLPLISFHNPPWQILKTNESGDVTEFSGLVFDIIKELANNLNFTYTVEIIKPNITTLTMDKNLKNISNSYLSSVLDIGTYFMPTGILEKIHNKTVALGACAFTVTEKNKDLINFTIPISIQSYSFLVARPRELSRALLFISPFKGDTWLCLSAAIISMGPILYYIHKYSPVYEYKGIRSKGGLSTIQNCIWYMYGALLQQGGMHLPYADSARIIVGSWWLVVLVIATTYCGNLVAFLTFPKIEVPITTINELISHKDTVTWSFPNKGFFEARLSTTNDGKYIIIKNEKNEIINKNAMLQKIKAGKHVYIDWKLKLQYIMKEQFEETGYCDLALGQDEFFDEQIALVVAPDTPYLLRINEEIRKLHQVGLIYKWLQDYLPKKDRCSKKRVIEVKNHTVNLDDMQGIFFVLFLGFSISLMIIFGERLWFKFYKGKKKNVQQFTT